MCHAVLGKLSVTSPRRSRHDRSANVSSQHVPIVSPIVQSMHKFLRSAETKPASLHHAVRLAAKVCAVETSSSSRRAAETRFRLNLHWDISQNTLQSQRPKTSFYVSVFTYFTMMRIMFNWQLMLPSNIFFPLISGGEPIFLVNHETRAIQFARRYEREYIRQFIDILSSPGFFTD